MTRCCAWGGESPAAPNSSLFGPNVYVFSPQSEKMQETISRIYATQLVKSNEFTDARYAVLFKPGQYDLDIRVGYYTQVSGVGLSPDEVTITGAVRSQDDPATRPRWGGPGAVTNFWRSVENLSIVPTLGSLTQGPPSTVPRGHSGIPLNHNVWAVSQGAPLRRIHIKPSPIVLSEAECRNAVGYSYKDAGSLIKTCPTTLRLFDGGWSSGGFMADTKVDGLVETGTQQQWFSRNSTWTQWNGENWNMVFLGSAPVPLRKWPGTGGSDGTITDGGPTPIVRETPFLSIEANGHYFVRIPELKRDSVGIDWNGRAHLKGKIPIEDFYIVKLRKGETRTVLDVARINAALRDGENLLFTPGVYYLNDTIAVGRADTVVFGLGLDTLVASSGRPIMAISDVSGVKLAGIIFDAGPTVSSTLLQVGEPGSANDHASDPTLLYDVFCRVGGSVYHRKTSSCVTINSNNVIGDDLWLWRADHGSNVEWDNNTADSGLIVNGSHATIYGLAVEHFQKYQTIWNGNFGRVYFYQSEMPYDPPAQVDWMNPGNPHPQGYASYKVSDKVSDHHAWGVGVYCYFRDAPVTAYHAVEVPAAVESGFKDLVTFWLNGKKGSEITHIINDDGAAVTESNRKATLP